jgi:hypothetical protein
MKDANSPRLLSEEEKKQIIENSDKIYDEIRKKMNEEIFGASNIHQSVSIICKWSVALSSSIAFLSIIKKSSSNESLIFLKDLFENSVNHMQILHEIMDKETKEGNPPPLKLDQD